MKVVDSRKERRVRLIEMLNKDPFLTDAQLAEELDVSIATIRLDRMALNIPELRERTKDVATKAHEKLRSIPGEEIIGELMEIELGHHGKSILRVTNDMVFAKNKILRGHYLFAQANSLAVAIVNTEFALTASASIKFIQPVKLHQRVVALGKVIRQRTNRYHVAISSYVDERLVFEGEVEVADLHDREGER